MPPVTCTGCRSPIPVPADHADPTIRCGICWTEVPVPAAAAPQKPKPTSGVVTAKPLPPKSAPVPVAAPLPPGVKPGSGMARLEALIQKADTRLRPPAPIPVARALPLPPPPPPAAPEVVDAVEVVEAEVVAPPVIPPRVERPKPARRVDDEAKPKPRYKTRGRRDDDDDADDAPPRKTGNGALVFALAGAAVVLIAVVGGGVLIVRSLGGGADDAANAGQFGQPGNNFNPQANPNPLPNFQVPEVKPVPDKAPPVNNDPPPPRPRANPLVPNVPPQFDALRDPAADLEWKAFAGDGFTAKFPGDPRTDNHWDHVFREQPVRPGTAPFAKMDGKKTSANDKGYTFEVSYVEAPADFPVDLKRMLSPFQHEQTGIKNGRVGGRQALELSKPFGPMVEDKKVVQVGRRVYVFRAHTHPIFGRTPEHAETARKTFFDSIKFGVGGDNALAPKADDPPAAAGPRDLVAAARLDPFWAAVVLPKRGEVLTFAPRAVAGKVAGAGLVRRYSFPGFEPKSTYHLPLPVTAAVADEATGKLVVAAAKPDVAVFTAMERQAYPGEVQVYDLKPLFDGTLGERAELKPAATVAAAGRITGLELVGNQGAVLSVLSSGPRTRPVLKTKLTRFEMSGKTTGDLELPEPAWRLAASPDGRRLFASEAMLVAPAALPNWTVPRNAAVNVIDAAGWRIDRTLSLPGPALSLAAAGNGTLVAAAAVNGGAKLVAVPPAGVSVDLTADDGPANSAGYVALTADGKKLVTAKPREAGVEVYAVSSLSAPGGLRRLSDGMTAKPAAAADPVPVGGNFVLSPDGRYALFQVGVVLDLGKGD